MESWNMNPIRNVPIRNRCRCLVCGDVIESRYGHDFVRCGCSATAADGGRAYVRRVFTRLADGRPSYVDIDDADGENPYSDDVERLVARVMRGEVPLVHVDDPRARDMLQQLGFL